ncbi:proteasome subunit alpha type-3 [Tanacetum coccineum]
MASRSNTRSTLYTGNDRNWIWIWAAIVIGIFLVIFDRGLLWYLKMKKIRQKEETQNMDSDISLSQWTETVFWGLGANPQFIPFGYGVILGGYDRDGPQLYMVEPSGVSYGLLAEHQRWSKVSEATTIRSSDSTGMSAIGDRSSHLSALDSNVQARTSACGIQEHQLFQEKNQLFIKVLPKKSGGSCHHTSGNRSVVHDTVASRLRTSGS